MPPPAVNLQGDGLRTAPELPTPIIDPIPAVLVLWRNGAIRLQATCPPAGFSKARWTRAGVDVARLVENHGAALQAAGWDALDLFGLNRFVPGTRPDCMGLGMLLDGRRVGSITPKTVEIVTGGGHTLRFSHMTLQARCEATLAWALG